MMTTFLTHLFLLWFDSARPLTHSSMDSLTEGKKILLFYFSFLFYFQFSHSMLYIFNNNLVMIVSLTQVPRILLIF